VGELDGVWGELGDLGVYDAVGVGFGSGCGGVVVEDVAEGDEGFVFVPWDDTVTWKDVKVVHVTVAVDDDHPPPFRKALREDVSRASATIGCT
jgi:hypothetical protein